MTRRDREGGKENTELALFLEFQAPGPEQADDKDFGKDWRRQIDNFMFQFLKSGRDGHIIAK